MIKKYKNKSGIKNKQEKKEKITEGKSRFLFESNLMIDGKTFKRGIHLIDDKFLLKNGICHSGKCPLIRKIQ